MLRRGIGGVAVSAAFLTPPNFSLTVEIHQRKTLAGMAVGR
jgi:hypothetical protein